MTIKFALKFWLLLLSIISVVATANPQGGNVVAGDAQINEFGQQLIVDATDGAIINWNDFDIAAGEITQFNIDNNGAVLNRVVGASSSTINGFLGSNGDVYLINPNGVVFGDSALVDTAGLVATSLDFSNDDFLNGGSLSFQAVNSQTSAAAVSNAGLIQVAEGGSVLLLGGNVNNTGRILAPDGHVFLVAANRLTMVDTENPVIAVDVQSVLGSAMNDGGISAVGGQVDISGVLVKNCNCVDADRLVLTEYGELELVTDVGSGATTLTRTSEVTDVAAADMGGPCSAAQAATPTVLTEADINDALLGVSTGLGAIVGGQSDDEPTDAAILNDTPSYQPPCI